MSEITRNNENVNYLFQFLSLNSTCQQLIHSHSLVSHEDVSQMVTVEDIFFGGSYNNEVCRDFFFPAFRLTLEIIIRCFNFVHQRIANFIFGNASE